MYHIILQEMRKNLLEAAVQIHDVIHKIEHFDLRTAKCTSLHQRLDREQRVESSYLNHLSLVLIGNSHYVSQQDALSSRQANQLMLNIPVLKVKGAAEGE